MKATIEFNLPDEASEHRAAINGMGYRCALSDIHEQIRQRLKHGHQLRSADDALEWMRAMVEECIEESEETPWS
jgi:transposase-like protein